MVCLNCFTTLPLPARRLNGILITVSNSAIPTPSAKLCTTTLLTFRKGETKRIYCDDSTTGRYVRITLPGKEKQLVICEVEVYGIAIGKATHAHMPHRCAAACDYNKVSAHHIVM